MIALSIAGVVWFHGYTRGEIKLFEYQAEQAKAAVVIVKKIERVKETVRVVHTKREKEIELVFVPIEKESLNVPVRAACNITAGWMHSHNAAASADGRAEGRMDDQADTGITEARALAEVRANYKAYHQVANDLTACRGYVHGLAEVTK